MGKVSFPLGENAAVLQKLVDIKGRFLYHVKPLLSGRSIGPSDPLHPAASTLRTDADVDLPYGL